ncbi:MAG: hypothetical protein Q8R02_04655 [Hyphomonadaceae bacterium]|nr:hypothetical protein [Hyphomonadaceae bacterium]
MKSRRKRRLPFAVYAALTFNLAICVTPFIAARAISTAYGDKRPAYEATSEAVVATRQAMDSRFEKLAANGEGAPRDVWSALVREQLEANNMSAVDGLLQAAPAMLNGADGAALKARVAVADDSGEKAVLAAAVAYLPEDMQDEYERRNAPTPIAYFKNTAPAHAVDGAKPAAAQIQADAELARAEDESEQQEFRMLGDMRDLSITAARWARNDRIDEFAFTLAGVGLILADPEAREGASIALSARRGQSLDNDFQLYLEQRLYSAVDPADLKRLLDGEFQSDFGYGTTGPAVVENVFKSTVNRGELESVLADLRIVRDIARETSTESAVAIISSVKDGSDLRRASLVARAGGKRAVPLALYDGEHLLDTARTVITWNNALRLQVAGLVACLALLGFISLSVLVRSFTRDRPKKRHAVYLTQDRAA